MQSPDDDTATTARLPSAIKATTEYNMRYKLTISAPAGEYELVAYDASGGRYLAPRGAGRVDLLYSGVAVIGGPSSESVIGGIHVAHDGVASLYWFWAGDSIYPNRIPVSGLQVAVTTDIDPGRRADRLEREARAKQAKLDAEERERQAKLEAEERERQAAAERGRRARQQADLAAAMLRNSVKCVGVAQCDRTFAQAQAYVLQQSDMRIQVATNTLIETYNGNDAGKISMRIVRAPTAGDAWEVQMTAACNDDKRPDRYGDICERALLAVYSGFLPHMQRAR